MIILFPLFYVTLNYATCTHTAAITLLMYVFSFKNINVYITIRLYYLKHHKKRIFIMHRRSNILLNSVPSINNMFICRTNAKFTNVYRESDTEQIIRRKFHINDYFRDMA